MGNNTHKKSVTKKSIILATLFLLGCTTSLFAAEKATPESGHNGHIRWQLFPSWKTGEKIIDMVHSLDGKRVFFLTANNQVHIYSTKGKRLGVMPVPQGVSNIDISPVGNILYLFDNDTNAFTAASLVFQHDIDTADAPVQGAAEAPISIVVFTDFECPYCKKIPTVLEEILEKNPQTVKVVFKNMPLISIHKMAEKAARASIAAKNQGKFWQYHDKLFAAETLTEKTLEDFARELNLDMEKFNKDLSSSETTAKLRKDMLDARAAGVEGTPSVFINGWALGDRSVNGFQEMIDALLDSSEKK